MKRPKVVFLMILSVVVIFSLLVVSAKALDLPVGVKKIADYENQLASSVGLLIAFFAGIITFTSPCGFALVPTYLSFAFKNKKESLYMASAFSIGLVIAFVLFGVIAGYVGEFFNKYKLGFSIFAGSMLFIFGILTLLNKGFAGFNFQTNISEKKTFLSMLSVGFLFGAAWTPCIGTVLLGIILVGANAGNVLGSAFLLGAYSLGVVFPLLIVSGFADKYDFANSSLFKGKTIYFTLFKKKIETHTYNIFGGLILMLLGSLIISYQGTFFFQTTMTKYLPWSMWLWSYLNEALISSSLLSSKTSNILGGIVLFIIGGVIIYGLATKKRK